MIFTFLKYVKPIWYFNLRSISGFGYFPTLEELRAESVELELDNFYSDERAKKLDLGWRAFHLGFVSKNIAGFDVWSNQRSPIPVQDEYRFVKKNFSAAWVYYILIIRILTLHNPVKEILAFIKNLSTARLKYAEPVQYPNYRNFESVLLKSNPLVSIVIPTLNRYKYLKDVFKDLGQQRYKNFEVIVVDQTDAFDESAYVGWDFNLKYWFQPEKALWKARNDAIIASKGDLILLYDDDSLVEPDWIEQHVKALDFFDCHISSGVSISTVGDKVPAHYSYFRWSDQLDTGNVLVKKEVFKAIGLFDRQFEKQRMGDGEFGLRAYLAGFANVSNPYAKRVHLKVSAGGLRQMGSWDGWRPKNIFAPRPVPSVLYLSRKYFGNKLSVYHVMVSILPSIVPYKYKHSTVLKVLSVLSFPILLPLFFVQVYRSWRLASIKLREGHKIEKLSA